MQKERETLNGPLTDPTFHVNFLNQIVQALEIPIELRIGIHNARHKYKSGSKEDRIKVIESVVSQCINPDILKMYNGRSGAERVYFEWKRSEELKQTLKQKCEEHDRGSKEQYVSFIEHMIYHFTEENDESPLMAYKGAAGAEKAILEMEKNKDNSDVIAAMEKLSVAGI